MDDKEKWTLSSLDSQSSTDNHSFIYKLKLMITNLGYKIFSNHTTSKLVVILIAILGVGGFILFSHFVNKPQQASVQPTATPDTSSPIPDFTPSDTPIDATTNSTLGVSTSVKATSS